jgi:hypothetical protein
MKIYNSKGGPVFGGLTSAILLEEFRKGVTKFIVQL